MPVTLGFAGLTPVIAPRVIPLGCFNKIEGVILMAKSNSFCGVAFVPKKAFEKNGKMVDITTNKVDESKLWQLYKDARTAGLEVGLWKDFKVAHKDMNKQEISGIYEVVYPKKQVKKAESEAKQLSKAEALIMAKNPKLAAMLAMFK